MKKAIKKEPKDVRYKYFFKKKLKKTLATCQDSSLLMGLFGFRSLDFFRLTFEEIESVRRGIAFWFKRMKIYFRVELCVPICAKPTGMRMGKGKSKINLWVANIKKGSVVIELDSFPSTLLQNKINNGVCRRISANIITIRR